MKTAKLTLSMPKKTITQAKKYSHETGKSISEMFRDFIEKLPHENFESDYPITPLVRTMTGIFKTNRDPEDLKWEYLREKYHL